MRGAPRVAPIKQSKLIFASVGSRFAVKFAAFGRIDSNKRLVFGHDLAVKIRIADMIARVEHILGWLWRIRWRIILVGVAAFIIFCVAVYYTPENDALCETFFLSMVAQSSVER
jgi:hypothetical protein